MFVNACKHEYDFVSQHPAVSYYPIPAIESAHAIAYAMKYAPSLPKDKIIVVTVSGRGDKDVESMARYRGQLSE